MENRRGSLMEQIDVRSVARDVLREWWIILLVSVAVSLFVNLWMHYSYQPQYTTSSTFVVTAKGMNNSIYQNLTSTKELAETFSNILESNVLKKKVAQELGMDSFQATTTVEILPETNLLALTVTADQAEDAYRIMNSILKNYNSVSDYVISNVILEVLKQPTIPMSPSNPLHTKDAMKKSFLLTAAVMVFGLMLLSFFRDTVKNEKDVAEKIDTKLLGTISHEKKAKSLKEVQKREKISMLISNPLLSFRFVESNRMLAFRIRSQMDKHNHKVLMVTSVMENEGKSTIAANLALSLAQENYNVLLLDLDFRKPAQYKIFAAKEEAQINLPEILEGKENQTDVFYQYADTSLYTVFNHTATTSVEKLLGKDTLERLIAFAKEKMDYIIVDTSPMAHVSDTEELAQLADASVLVVREDMVLAKDINDAIDALNRTNGKVMGCIFNDAGDFVAESVSRYGYGGHYGYGD